MGSPIEGRLYSAIASSADRMRWTMNELENFERGRAEPPAGALLYFEARRNVVVSTYKVDILLQGDGWNLAVECDGHEFHDRTKQQAAYDRSRDRELILLGITTIRFTGSEIVHSVERCATQTMEIVQYLTSRNAFVLGLLHRCGER